MEGSGWMLLDFHAPTKESLTYKCQLLKFLKTGFRRRTLLRGPGFEKMVVASWHIQTLLHHISSTFGRVCRKSHENMVDERPI